MTYTVIFEGSDLQNLDQLQDWTKEEQVEDSWVTTKALKMARLRKNSCHFQLVRVKAKERVGESKIERRQDYLPASLLSLAELLIAEPCDWLWSDEF